MLLTAVHKVGYLPSGNAHLKGELPTLQPFFVVHNLEAVLLRSSHPDTR